MSKDLFNLQFCILLLIHLHFVLTIVRYKIPEPSRNLRKELIFLLLAITNLDNIIDKLNVIVGKRQPLIC